MKTVFENTVSFLLWSILVVSCNNSATRKNVTIDTTADTTAIKIAADTGKKAEIIREEAIDYTKENINLTQQQWADFRKTYHVNAEALTGYDKIAGDFNSDGKKETIFIVPPAEDTTTKDAFQECIGGCNSYVVSSDTAMMILKIDNNLGGEIKNLGDLDGDGADDIMVYPSWWQSNWNAYKIYSVNTATRQWCYLVEPVTIFANELEKHISFVKKAKQKGFLSVYTTITDEEGDFHSQYKSFKILK